MHFRNLWRKCCGFLHGRNGLQVSKTNISFPTVTNFDIVTPWLARNIDGLARSRQLLPGFGA
jgi:hypothetical protein